MYLGKPKAGEPECWYTILLASGPFSFTPYIVLQGYRCLYTLALRFDATGMIVDNVCDPVPPGRDGYETLSGFMSSYPEMAIFRRFRALEIQNLLYLQAEITHLEAELQDIATEDRHLRESARHLYHRSWWELSQESDEKCNNPQWAKVLEIRDKLEQYSMGEQLAI